jgi:hypothetical protein
MHSQHVKTCKLVSCGKTYNMSMSFMHNMSSKQTFVVQGHLHIYMSFNSNHVIYILLNNT